MGTIGKVELRYSTDGGNTFPDTKVIVSGITPDSSPYAWTIPDDISSTVRVNVLLVSDSTVFDISDGDFSIKGNLVITAPNGGEIWEVETYQSITWDRLGASLGTVSLYYSVNSGADGYPYLIASGVDSGALSYSWFIPDAIGNLVRVKIVSDDDPSINDTSDAVFQLREDWFYLRLWEEKPGMWERTRILLGIPMERFPKLIFTILQIVVVVLRVQSPQL